MMDNSTLNICSHNFFLDTLKFQASDFQLFVFFSCLFIGIVIAILINRNVVECQVKEKAYQYNLEKYLKFYGLFKPRGNFANFLVHFGKAPKHHSVYVDDLNNLILGTKPGDIFDEAKAIGILGSWLSAGRLSLDHSLEALSFLTYLNHYPDKKYHPADMASVEDQRCRIRRTCKIGFQYFTATYSFVSFILDGINFDECISYYQTVKPTNPKGITQSELNYLIRKFVQNPQDGILQKVTFYLNYKKFPFPWVDDDTPCSRVKIFSQKRKACKYFSYYTQHLGQKWSKAHNYHVQRRLENLHPDFTTASCDLENLRCQLHIFILEQVCNSIKCLDCDKDIVGDITELEKLNQQIKDIICCGLNEINSTIDNILELLNTSCGSSIEEEKNILEIMIQAESMSLNLPNYIKSFCSLLDIVLPMNPNWVE